MRIKNRANSLFLFICVFLLSGSPVHAAYWSPHIGVDAVDWGVKPRFQDQQLFPRVERAGNIYVGTRINGYFGIDVGFEQSSQKQKSEVFTGGTQNYFSQIEANYDAATVDIRLRAPHVDLNFYWEVVRRLELLFMLGVAKIQPNTHIMHLSKGTWLEFENTSPPFYSGRFGFGIQFNPCPRLGIKGLVNWDQTLRLQYTGINQNNVFYSAHPYQRATSFSLGVVYSFSNPRRGKYSWGYVHQEGDDYHSLNL